MSAERVTLTDATIRTALTVDPAAGADALVWDEVLAGIAVTPQRARALVTLPWTPALPGLPVSQRRRRARQLAVLLAAALLIGSSVAVVGLIGGLRRLPPPIGLARPGLIAYDADGDIFVSKADGTGVRNLTGGAAQDIQPVWSPDGTRLGYQSLSADSTIVEINVIDPSGENRITIATKPSVSTRSLSAVQGWRLSWAPDSRSVAYTDVVEGRSQVSVARADGSGSVVIGDRSLDGIDPMWSPDGTKIAFRGGRYDDARGVYVMDADGSHVRRLTATRPDTDAAMSYLGPTWSPDSRSIAYQRMGAANSSPDGIWNSIQIWVIDVASGTEHPITDDVADNEYGTWSPDGTQIAYTRYLAGGVPQFVVARPDGSDAVILPPAVRGVPTWSPDGLKLFGRAFLDASVDTSIAVIDIATRTGTIVTPTEGAHEIYGDGSWQRLAN